MIQAETTNTISQLTQLVAAHGVYALTIIFIFYQQWRSFRNLKMATPQDQVFFRKLYGSAVTATYALVLISTAVWIYANFIYLPRVYIRGSVSRLTDQATSPLKQGDPAKVNETIAPESLDIDLYQSKKNKDETSSEGKYDLGWVLMPRDNVHTLVFRFQHAYREIKSTRRISLNPGVSANSPENGNIEKRFSLDLRKINYSPGRPIELVYEADSQDPVERIGKIYLIDDSGNRRPIPWEEVTPGMKTAENDKSRPPFLSAAVVYASSPERPIFKENGDYDPQLGRVLRERLGNSDLGTQLAARDALVQSGKSSFKFILDSLSASSDGQSNRGLLVPSLASVVLDIDAAGTPVPHNIYLGLAKAFLELNDAQSSAQFFDKAGEKPDDPPDLHVRRGLVYNLTKQYEKSITNLNRYLETNPPAPFQAIARGILGADYEQLGRIQEAINEYRKAIQIYPTYPNSYNNLAYIYAERGDKLDEALSLVNRALALDKNPDEIASIKDTKGWILFKQGKYDQALPLIKEAASRIQDDPTIREHLKAVQDASLRGPKK